jgi:hypothetical protein
MEAVCERNLSLTRVQAEEKVFGDAFSPRSILRTKPILRSARIVLSHSGNDRYRNIRTQPGLNSLGMSCDNPSRGADPWTTLKQPAKTKSLRFVRLVRPFQPSRKVQGFD